MSGLPRFNWDAFDAADRRLSALGWATVNPAEIDRIHGVDPDRPEEFSEGKYREMLGHDLAEITRCDAIAMLPGWRKSRGARIEHALAETLKLRVLDAETGEPLVETGLQEAQRLVYGDRGEAYGHPLDDYSRTAEIWSAILGHTVTAEQAILCMIGVKLSRECHAPKRDNMVDAAGYAECLLRVRSERARREAANAETEG
jgi:hypothetical protein